MLTAGPILVSSNRRPALAKLKRSEVLIFYAAACDTGTHSGLCPQQGLSASKTQQNIAHNLGYPSRWVNFGIRTIS